jgi:hypothetical protein
MSRNITSGGVWFTAELAAMADENLPVTFRNGVLST